MTPIPKPARRESGVVKNLSEALGVSRRRVSTLLSDGMPSSIPEAMAWRGQSEASEQTSQPQEAPDDHSPAELRRRRIAMLRRQEEKLAIEIQVRKGELIALGEVEARDARIGNCVKMAILRQRSELPPQLEGLSAIQIAVILDEYNRAMLEEMSDVQSPFWNH